ncbi:LysR substrate-binding domain-containing protein [Pseudidiomarina aestuarii]|uniref:LysR substrate-binding domain-containing protein n=1 Tax=Pseudidiomarina aestuarii TaxID=624146 RepID=UPI003A976E99
MVIDINDYYYFVKVVENRGFSSAARALNTSKSKVSRHVAKLEERLGHRLLQRTSRHFNTTEAGELFYLRARRVIDAMELAENAMSGISEGIAGTVSLSSSVGVANFLVKELMIDFLERNPEVIVKQNTSNEYIDIIPAGLDMVIRGHQGALPDSSYIQRKMAKVDWYLFASPDFLAKLNVAIASPTDIIGLSALGFGWQSIEKSWSLQHKQEPIVEVAYRPHFCSDDMWTLKRAAERGQGLVSLPAYVCKEEIAKGSLVRVLPEWITASTQLSILQPSRKGVSEATKALSNYLCENAQRLANPGY